MSEVEVVLGRLVPRQRGDPLEVGADDAVLGGLRRQRLQALELAVDLAADVLGQRDGVELLAQLVGLGGRLVELAELAADGVELLAQDELALALVDLRLDLVLDLRADRDDLELAREDVDQAPQAQGDVDLLEQPLLLLALQAQRAGDEVAERARVVDVGDRELQLLGQVRDCSRRSRRTSAGRCASAPRARPTRRAPRRAARRSRPPGRASRPPSGRCGRAGRPGRGSASSRRAP